MRMEEGEEEVDVVVVEEEVVDEGGDVEEGEDSNFEMVNHQKAS